MATTKKYLDQSRFPKVVTEGYERNFKSFYTFTLENTIKELAIKANKIIK